MFGNPHRSAGALLLALLYLPACGRSSRQDPPRPDIDLVARFPTARIGLAAGQAQIPGAPRPRVQPDRSFLLVPFGASVSYELEIGREDALLTANVFSRGSATGALEVSWQPEGGLALRLTSDLSAAPGRSVDLPPGPHRGQLTLTASATRVIAAEGAAMILQAPRIGHAGRPLPAGSQPPPPSSPNLIIYLVDALRADHLGCYGYRLPTSPFMDRFAAESVLFDDAQAQSSWTRSAVASLFTGLWPQVHGANDRDDVLSEDAVTLAELLRTAGYATAAVVANGNIDIAYGLGQGFDYYKYLQQVRLGDIPARSERVNEAVSLWLDQRPPGRSFFLYVHTIDPHLPYDPPEFFRARFADEVSDSEVGSLRSIERLNGNKSEVTPGVLAAVTSLYDAEIAANDAAFGALVSELQRRGLYDSSVIVVLSDHGEELFDHRGFSHGNTLFEEVLRVPLAIRFPDGRPPRRVSSVVEQVDLMPTLLQYLGLKAPPGIHGESFLALCGPDRTTRWKDRAVAYLQLKERRGASYLDGQWKLLLRPRGEALRRSLFDRRADCGELHDVADREPDLVRSLGELLDSLLDNAGPSLDGGRVEDERDRETREQLKAIGYI